MRTVEKECQATKRVSTPGNQWEMEEINGDFYFICEEGGEMIEKVLSSGFRERYMGDKTD